MDAVDAAAARWRDGAFAVRRRTRDSVAERTGYSLPVVEYAFDRLFGTLSRDSICAVITDELGSLDVLDDFVQRTGRPRTHALPIGRICIVASRTTIGVAIVPAVFALVAKCHVLVKDREDRLVAAFFETLADELPELQNAALARPWRGDGDSLVLGTFDGVVAFGDDSTLQEIGSLLSARTRFIPLGSKASAGYVAREALRDEACASAIAREAARDLILYESEGCLSLHALFVEKGGRITVERFGEILADAVRRAEAEFPPVDADAGRSARAAIARELATFRGGREGIHLATRIEEPPLFFPRSLGVRAVDAPQEAAAYLLRHGIELEALAVAGRREDLAELAIQTRTARIVPFGTMQAPPLGTYHGGRPRIAEFVRWIVDET